MSIVTERVYRATSWDAERQAVVDRVFTENDLEDFKDIFKAIHCHHIDEMDLLSFIKHRYYGAPYYEIDENRYAYHQADDTSSTDGTPQTDNTVQLSDDALHAVGSKLSPVAYGKMAMLNLFDQKPAYQYADVFPMTAAMRAIDESIKTGHAEPWLPTIRKAMSPQVSQSMLIPNVWLTQVNPVTSIVMAQNSGRWSEAWLNTEQYKLLQFNAGVYLATIIDENTPPMYPEWISFDVMMLSQHEHKVALADKFVQSQHHLGLYNKEINLLRALLDIQYTGDAYAYINLLHGIIDYYRLGSWLQIKPAVMPGAVHITLDNGRILSVVSTGDELGCYHPDVNEGLCYSLESSRILTQQVLSDPAVTRLVSEQPDHPIARALYLNREVLDLGALDDMVLVQWAQQIRNGIYQ